MYKRRTWKGFIKIESKCFYHEKLLPHSGRVVFATFRGKDGFLNNSCEVFNKTGDFICEARKVDIGSVKQTDLGFAPLGFAGALV